MYKGRRGHKHLFKLYSKSQNDFNSEKDVPKNLFEEKKNSKKCLSYKQLTKFVCQIVSYTLYIISRTSEKVTALEQHNKALFQKGLAQQIGKLPLSFIFFDP